jgi:hypothetical protein
VKNLQKLKYFRVVLVAFNLVFFNNSFAQITWDTARNLSRHEGGYGKFKPSIKSSITYDDNIGLEIVRVRNNLSLVWLMNNTATKYYGINWVANKNYKIGLVGISAGGDIDFTIFHFGLSGLAQTDFKQIKFYIIPNIGISWWGTVGLFYGAKLSLNKQDFIGNNNYVMGIRYNFTKDLFKEFKDGVGY